MDSNDRIGVFSFAVPGKNALDIADALADKHICVRAGGHCAHPLLLYCVKLCRLYHILYFCQIKRLFWGVFFRFWKLVLVYLVYCLDISHHYEYRRY